MSRTKVPPVQTASIILSSPYEPVIGVNEEIMAELIVYSGLLADSVAPAGEITSVEVPEPSAANNVASTDEAPYAA
jgi:hypothetical protein